MTFLHSEFIYLMLPILLILFGLLLTQSDAQELVFSPESLKKLRVDSDQLSAKVRNIFYFLMFLFIILALAGPVVEKGNATVKVKDDLLYIALDISDSMLCEDVYPNRLEMGKKKIMELLQQKSKRRIGLMAFAESSYLVSPPTLDHKILAFLLKPMNNSSTSEHGTNILNVLKAANIQFGENDYKRLLIVSDGGEKREFSEEIAYAKKEGIKVYLLNIGTERGGTIEGKEGPLRYKDEVVISRVNRAIEKLAVESGGAVLDPRDLSPFAGSLQGKSLEEDVKPIYVHFFIVPIALAMLMLLIATSSFHRGEKYYLPSAVMMLLLSAFPSTFRAELFDYQHLEQTQEAYKQEEYRLSAKGYESYALEHKSVEAAYNAANAYYRLERYKMAADLYRSIYFSESEQNHKLYHNLGNALAKIGDYTNLKKALEAYEKALRFKEDVESRENLEAVKEALRNRDAERSRSSLLQASSASSKTDSASSNVTKGLDQSRSSQAGIPANKKQVMSDMEAEKWFKRLDKPYTQTYKIDVEETDEGVDSAKPW